VTKEQEREDTWTAPLTRYLPLKRQLSSVELEPEPPTMQHSALVGAPWERTKVQSVKDERPPN
jgi:hypothetical protein